MLYDIIKWKSLSLIHKNKYTYHWKTIYNEFNKWSNDKVFELAFNKFVFNEYFKISKVKKDKKINLFIDVTKIYNLLGSDGITINGEIKRKILLH